MEITKEQLIKKLYNEGKITFEEVLVLAGGNIVNIIEQSPVNIQPNYYPPYYPSFPIYQPQLPTWDLPGTIYCQS